MNIFIYSDESGVFDKVHNDYFVFAGLVFLSRDARDDAGRKYITAEKVIRRLENINRESEVKAASVSNKDKGKLYRSLNHEEKFGVVVEQKRVFDSIFQSKKTKQRFLDYAYKIAVKKKFESLIERNLIAPDEVEGLYFFVDEHSTATDGLYELREALEQEFKIGTYNYTYTSFFPPLFTKLQTVDIKFCNSSSVTLVRAADIVANRLYFKARNGECQQLMSENFTISVIP